MRLPDGWTANEVAYRLLTGYGILVKDCSGKALGNSGQYLRVSSRHGHENRALVTALASVLGNGGTVNSTSEADSAV